MTQHPRIFYYCYRHNRPTGGQKHTYRHVDVLNKNGFEAYAFHPGDSFRLDWFANRTEVITGDEYNRILDPLRDYTVLPEDLGMQIRDFRGRKVIFNKNIFTGFQSLGRQLRRDYPYLDPNIVGAFCVSEHNRQILQFAFPSLRVRTVRIEVNPAIFYPVDLRFKKPQIACIDKNEPDLLSVMHVLHARSVVKLNSNNFAWRFLVNESEQETAQILRDSLILVFLSTAEGMGRLPLEAMASGCILAAYDSGPLSTVAPSYSGFRCGDIKGIAAFLESIIAAYPGGVSQWEPQIREGLAVAATFSPEAQEVSILESWTEFLAIAGGQDHR
jgi:glycosyltransferase involved in cell wall biosynthesis